MADVRYRIKSDILPIRVESGKLILPETIGALVENMYLTPEGTLRSVWGPAPYIPAYGGGVPAITYTRLHGIFHTRMWDGGQRDVLVIQDGDLVRVFEGWNGPAGAPWRNLIAPGGTGAQYNADIGADSKPRFPCQFESTPNGLVIIPSGESSRAFFYDGRTILPLGYSHGPPPPTGFSPETAGANWYNHTGKTMANATTPGRASAAGATGPVLDVPVAPPYMYGNSRLGTVDPASAANFSAGRVLEGSYRAAVQWVDRWGNLSPLSGRSARVHMPAVPAGDDTDTTLADLGKPFVATGESPASYLYQTFWTDIARGPVGTVGRILCRTPDELNSGSQKLFHLPLYAEGGLLSPGTIPDNVTEDVPDNVPDSWLIQEPVRPAAVTPFKLYKLGFGRGWAANFRDDPGKIHPSMPGKWGTFLEGDEIYPDPRGAEVTGLCQVPKGMLVFTENTTFLIVISYGGEGFQTQTLHPTIGCVAPSSVATMPNGMAVWLGREGFYGYKDEEVVLISEDIGDEVKRFTHSRLLQATGALDVREQKYRCWVPANGSLRNNLCYEYDGEGWTRRTDVEAADVCVTQDHRSYMIAGGQATQAVGGGASVQEGVWLLDHQVSTWTPLDKPGIVRTSWLRAPYSKGRGSPMTVYLWFRETESGTLNIEVERDWRVGITQTATATLHASENPPPFWNTATYGGDDAQGDPLAWRKRRPYWTRADIHVPSAETFRLTITHTGAWEFIGLAFDEVPRDDSFRSEPK